MIYITGPALLCFEVEDEDEWFAIARYRGEDEPVFLSDVHAIQSNSLRWVTSSRGTASAQSSRTKTLIAPARHCARVDNAQMPQRAETCPLCERVILLSARDDQEVEVALRLHVNYGCDG
ncbi:hypothetical protein ACIBI7_35990 [Nonomuraea fuscirosea]|uniref:hypothetical protein n=1 Tax=Nonomuraea fuscirosea TaxID=1291556 RepID=UPI0037AF8397